MSAIKSFKGTFLSNFWISPFEEGGKSYLTVEHYYQSKKASSKEDAEEIRLAQTPLEAKKLGQKCNLRKDWLSIRVEVMRKGIEQKYKQNEQLAKKLIDTGNNYLVEGNPWGDTFWGCDNKKWEGKNMLGHLLMELREELNGSVAELGEALR